ncbi:MAG: translation initiation factor IF-2 [Bacilli bacterium]|nr:translation initiation factor IF-2 [Bacilli bacterium]
MMSVLEYALDINRTPEEVLTECKKLQIDVARKEDILDEDAIIMLDSIFESAIEDDSDNLDKEVESIIDDSNIEAEETIKKVSIKKKKIDTKEEKENYEAKRKAMYKSKEKLISNKSVTEENIVLFKEGSLIKDFADQLEVNSTDLIKKLINLGIMATVNDSISFETAEIVAAEYNKELKREETRDETDFDNYEVQDKLEDLLPRPPVVTIMGHVDHGKTTLLDTIRKSSVVEGEAGGITQHIGAYQVIRDGKKITFIDTPGHAAFTEMRARGASVTDIVVIIVSAEDGFMPQTKEAIDHARAAKVPIIVAINKIDKPNANPEKILTELTEYGLTPEEWGGDILVNRISALKGDGVDSLLDNILLISEMLELKANPNRYAIGTVIEAKLDKKVGPIVTLLIQNGTLRLGDPLVVGLTHGRVRTLKNDLDKDIVEASPSMPIKITGLNEVPGAGDKFMAFETEKKTRSIAEERIKRTTTSTSANKPVSLDELFSKIQSGVKEINVVLKTDVSGSEEAVKNSLEKIDVAGVKVNIIRSGVGTITESDIVLANASDAIIIGFNVRPSAAVVDIAKGYNVDIRLYDIIYKVVEEMESAMQGMLDPVFEEKVLGQAEVRKLFKFSKVGNIAGCYVINGIIKRDAKVRIIRDGIVVYTGEINSVQRGKDIVKEVKQGFECGITIEKFNDIKENDIIEAFELVEIKK